MAAKRMIAGPIADFIGTTLFPQDGAFLENLLGYHSRTFPLVAGFFKAREMDHQSNAAKSQSTCGSLQLKISEKPTGVAERARVLVTNQIFTDKVLFWASHPQASFSSRRDLLIVNSTSFALPPYIFALPCMQQSPQEVACKMTTAYASNISSHPLLCAEWNRYIAELTVGSLLTEEQYDRFVKAKWTLLFEPDEIVTSGPAWLLSTLKFNPNMEQKTLRVTASALITDANSWLFPQCHYCKLLSPRTHFLPQHKRN